MQTIAPLPEPSSKHATCAWCAASFRTVIDLIDHVDDVHLGDKRAIETLPQWKPTPEEVAAIVSEMRPIIASLAARDQQRLSPLQTNRRHALSRDAEFGMADGLSPAPSSAAS